LEAPEGFSRAYWSTFAELGWLGVALPADVNGSGGGAVENALILEEFGRSLVLEPYWSCAVFAAQLLNYRATREQRFELLKPLVDGNLLIAVAHSEANAGACVEHVEAHAIDDINDGFVISGRKSLVVGGASADKFIVSARTSGATEDRVGISLFVVDRLASGLSRRHYKLLDGSVACDIEMTNVRVNKNDILGHRDSGAEAVELAVDQAAVGLCAEAVGIMDSVLYITSEYLKTRRQYGVTLSTFQALQHRMADMFVEVELSRSMLLRALSALNHEDRTARHLAALAARIHVSKSGKFVCNNGIQLHGAMGVVEEQMIGQYFKRMVVTSGLFGGVDQQLTRYSSLSA
jgi:alkylation response protein AidB-like acyl-CoA dehydrogenase